MMGFLFNVFSYFQYGITDTKPKKILDLPGLARMIKNHPQAEFINKIRSLRANSDKSYKILKTKLPNITPNCIIKERNLKTDDQFNNNFIQFSGYIYFDLDGLSDINEYKHYFIEKYSQIVSLVSVSSSLGGLSVLVKVTNSITKDNFVLIRSAIIESFFKDESEFIDEMCVDKGRAWFISSDPDVYVNFENEVSVSYNEIESSIIKKRVKQPISRDKDAINRLNYSFSELPTLDEVMSKIKLKTPVAVDNRIIDFKPAEYVEVTFPPKIKDKTKHKTYIGIIHKLVHLNPGVDKKYLFSYLNYLNNSIADPKMDYRELSKLFKLVYDSTQKDDYKFDGARIKDYHFNPSVFLEGITKKGIINPLNGKKRVNNSIDKIIEAKEFLTQNNIKVTQKTVAQHTRLSLKTVQTHFNSTRTDIVKLVGMINDSVEPDVKYNNIIQRNDDNVDYGYIHPECPQWVVDYFRTDTFKKLTTSRVSEIS